MKALSPASLCYSFGVSLPADTQVVDYKVESEYLLLKLQSRNFSAVFEGEEIPRVAGMVRVPEQTSVPLPASSIPAYFPVPGQIYRKVWGEGTGEKVQVESLAFNEHGYCQVVFTCLESMTRRILPLQEWCNHKKDKSGWWFCSPLFLPVESQP